MVVIDRPSAVTELVRSTVLFPPQLNCELFSSQLYRPATTGSPSLSALQKQFVVAMLVVCAVATPFSLKFHEVTAHAMPTVVHTLTTASEAVLCGHLPTGSTKLKPHDPVYWL